MNAGIIDPYEARRLIDSGEYTTTSYAKEVGVSKQAVHQALKKIGYRHPLTIARDYIPWSDMPPGAKSATPYQRLVQHLEFTAAGEKYMSEGVLKRLRNWYENTLEKFSVVVEYDPEQYPVPGQQFGHWRYVPREPRDGDLILRQNEHTKLTPAQKVLFRMPERFPNTPS